LLAKIRTVFLLAKLILLTALSFKLHIYSLFASSTFLPTSSCPAGNLLPLFSRDSRRLSYEEWEKPGEVRDKPGTRSKQGQEKSG
jgi:hypothetical protein